MNKEINFSIDIENTNHYFQVEDMRSMGQAPMDVWNYVNIPEFVLFDLKQRAKSCYEWNPCNEC